MGVVKVAIDDFGTGYSSLAYLRHWPVDILTIDRHFLKIAASDNKDASIVSVVIDLAHALELAVVVDGVEFL
ncbi:EAL domain-containing protein [Oceanobacter antarcticus]|uniref:EAL domain-containing protein n=1 Tax=Oceanobacter antarcticus TaxID=3133425 RepID=UPI003A100E97